MLWEITGETHTSRPRRVYYAGWKFEIGMAIQFGDVMAIVLSRSRTAMGRQLYHIWVSGESHGRPYRWVMG